MKNKTKKYILILLALIIIGAGIYLFLSKEKEPKENNNNPATSSRQIKTVLLKDEILHLLNEKIIEENTYTLEISDLTQDEDENDIYIITASEEEVIQATYNVDAYTGHIISVSKIITTPSAE